MHLRAARAPRVAPAAPEVARVIELMLQSQDPDQVKAGLQRACEVLERGQAFTDSNFLRMGLSAHLGSPWDKIRRWAYKLSALLRDADQLPLLERALINSETDPENRGWAAAAYWGIADEGSRDRLIAKLDDYWETSLELAGKLYARGQPAREDLKIEVWERDPLARKWLCLLCGYAPDKPRTIDRRYDNLDLVRNSINDNDPEIVEYSIWAEHHHPGGSSNSLLRRPDELLAHSNVRRWLYRLLTKDNKTALAHRDLLLEGMLASTEVSEVAREGLALGFSSIYSADFRFDTIEWFATEQSIRVKLALVDNLAVMANKHDDAVARDILKAAYYDQPDSLLGAKIMSVARGDWQIGYRNLPPSKPIALASDDLFGALPITKSVLNVNIKELHVGNKIEQSGSNNAMTGVTAGDMYNSTIHALNHQKDQRYNDLTPLIEAFLKTLSKSSIDEDEKKAALEAAEAAANATGDEKRSKFGTLKTIVRGLIAAPGAAADLVEGGQHLMTAIQGAIS